MKDLFIKNCQKSGYDQAEIIILSGKDTRLLHYSELTIKGVYHHTPYYVRKAFKLIEKGLFDTSKFITSDMPLERLVEALELMGKQKGIKYNITI